MIKLYEVSFELESGNRLNVLMAAPSQDEAKRAAHDTLCHASEPKGVGDALRYCWRFDEITVREVTLTEERAAA